jgi:hypothetical protein
VLLLYPDDLNDSGTETYYSFVVAEFDFCPLKAFVVNRHYPKKRTTLTVSWGLTQGQREL